MVKAAREAGVQRIIVTHPEFPTTFLSLEQHRELTKYDVMFERCFTTPYTNKVSWEQVVQNIREIGPSTTILATDLGQTFQPPCGRGHRHLHREDAGGRVQRERDRAPSARQRRPGARRGQRGRKHDRVAAECRTAQLLDITPPW